MRPIRTAADLCIVSRKENFVYWCAWRHWLHTRCQQLFFPDVMTLWSEWPPETMDEVRAVVEKKNEARRIANADSKVHGRLLPMLPDELEPADRWSANQIIEYERRHREDAFWTPSLGGDNEEEKLIPLARVAAVIEATYRRHKYNPKPKSKSP